MTLAMVYEKPSLTELKIEVKADKICMSKHVAE